MKERRNRAAQPLRQFFRQQKYLLLKLHRSLRSKPNDAKSHKYAKNYLKQSINKVVEETNPQIRIVDGYYRTLKKHIYYPLAVADKIVQKVNFISDFSAKGLDENGMVSALFYDMEKMHKVLTGASAYREHISKNPVQEFQPVYGLLTVKLQEQVIFQPALQNGQVVNDVRQERVSFNNPRIVFVCESEAAQQQQLKAYLMRRLLTDIKQQLDQRLVTGYQQAKASPQMQNAPLSPPEYLTKLCQSLIAAESAMFVTEHKFYTDNYGIVDGHGEKTRDIACWQLHVNEQEPRIMVPFCYIPENIH